MRIHMNSRFGKYILFLTSLILSMLFVTGAYLCARSFMSYKALEQRVKAARTKVIALEEMKKEQMKANRLLARIIFFTEKARSLGLLDEYWNRYEVDIHEKVSFPELAEILEQTVTSSNYYFEPLFLYVSEAPPPSQGTEAETAMGTQAAPLAQGQAEQGDVYLKLKGFFLVRRR